MQVISNQYKNQGSRTTSGFDVDFSHQFELGNGQQLKLKSVWSKLLSYQQALVAGQPLLEGAGNNQFGALPAWRSNNSINWQQGDWQATLSADFTSGYDQAIATQDAPIRACVAKWPVTPSSTVS